MTTIRKQVQKYAEKVFIWDVFLDDVLYATGTYKTKHGANGAADEAIRQAMEYLDGKAVIISGRDLRV